MDNVFSLRNLGSLDTYTLDKLTTVMGRKPDCDLVIDSEESSREHAVLKLEGGQLILEDLGSTNGTYLNNVRIRSRTPAKGGDVIGIGGQRFRVIAPSSSSNTTMIGAKTVDESSFVLEKDSPESTAIRQRYVMPPGWKSEEREGFTDARSRFEQEMDEHLQNRKVSASTHSAALLTVGGSNKHVLYLLPRAVGKGPWLIGRAGDCAITIENESVSNHHATLTRNDGKWVIEDKGSTNGLKVNGLRTQLAVITSGDRVSFGEIELLFRAL